MLAVTVMGLRRGLGYHILALKKTQSTDSISRCLSVAVQRKKRPVKINREVGLRIIELVKPKKLNPANAEVLAAVQRQMRLWEDNWMVKVAVLKGRQGFFCSGVDLKALVDNKDMVSVHLQRLCKVVKLLNSSSKPVVSIIDGACFGSGYALAMGKYRICTERSVFSVPEPSLGVALAGGLSYALPRLLDGSESLALCLGLTGITLEGVDIHAAQLATHFMPSTRLKLFMNRLSEVCMVPDDLGGDEGLQAIAMAVEMCSDISWESSELHDDLVELGEDREFAASQNHLHKTLPEIDDVFAVNSVEEAVNNLKSCNHVWTKVALENMAKSSPLSLKVVFEQIKRGKNLTLSKCLEEEYNVNSRLYLMDDFKAAMKAQQTEPGKQPMWRKGTLEEVSADDVTTLFQ